MSNAIYAETPLLAVREREIEVKSSIASRLENRALRWYGQVSRMGEERWPKRILEWSPRGRRRRGQPAVKWKTSITETMEGKGLKEGD
ncbi:hypothetical protein ILUMI_18425 [Ignelater luminosus]|uniref:Uncharacterized protein n=1 Tax=Ignelater luminosus TaxID=2038154 RepID=A0A8K0CNM0_IGNLU|nr:hypothetical protein ILUMI_18425 [Ignelater luminosus]